MKVHELFESEERSVLSVFGQSPEHKNGNFYCSNSKLTSLEGSPKYVSGEFQCGSNKLKSLKFGPIKVDADFDCGGNQIESLEDAPTEVGASILFSKNKLTSLHNIHKHIKHIGRIAYFQNNPIQSHVLGLLLIDELKAVCLDNRDVQLIINKHLNLERDVFACQEELIEAGLEEFAQL